MKTLIAAAVAIAAILAPGIASADTSRVWMPGDYHWSGTNANANPANARAAAADAARYKSGSGVVTESAPVTTNEWLAGSSQGRNGAVEGTSYYDPSRSSPSR